MSLCLIAVFFAGLTALPASAQFWEKKDWREWSKSECERMLTDSPWARTYENALVVADARGIGSGEAGAERNPEREARPKIEYVVQLRSALPIRLAVIRSMQIQTKYDKMSAAEKASFDKQAEDFINQDFGDRVVVHVNYSSNVTIYHKALDDIWRAYAATELAAPSNTYLITPRGEPVDVMRFIPAGPSAPEFEVLYPKQWKGNPVAAEGDRRLHVQLPGMEALEERNKAQAGVKIPKELKGSVLVEFDIRKMKYKGNLEY